MTYRQNKREQKATQMMWAMSTCHTMIKIHGRCCCWATKQPNVDKLRVRCNNKKLRWLTRPCRRKTLCKLQVRKKSFHFLLCWNLICLPESPIKYVCCCRWLFIYASISIHKSFRNSHLLHISTKVPTTSLTSFPAPTLCSIFCCDLQVKHNNYFSHCTLRIDSGFTKNNSVFGPTI